MRCILLVSGGGNIEAAKSACLDCDMVIILHLIDQDLLSDMPPAKFAEILQRSEEDVEELEEELRKAGVNVRVESAWGPVREKLINAAKLWEADRTVVLISGSPLSEKLKAEIGKVRGVRFI